MWTSALEHRLMTLRFIDSEQTIALSVGDVVALGARGG
ncbi:MAG: hypothetical protein ACJATT_004497, partial [Myxococcota bacterium]